MGPDAFNPTGLGSIVTIRWLVRVGSLSGAVRLWVPESVVQLWITSHAVTTAGERQRTEQVRTTEQPRANAATVPRGELAGAGARRRGL